MHSDGYKPIISIIIPVHNQSQKTIRCFASIRASTKTPYEIVWVDNGSHAEHFGPIKRQAVKPRVHTKLVKFKQNVGFVKATNAGIKEVEESSKYIILLNNDTEVTPGWEQRLIYPLEQDPKIGAVGPVTQSKISWQEAKNLNLRWKYDVPIYHRRRGGTYTIQEYGKTLGKLFGNKYVEIGKIPLSFFCAAFRKEIFDEVGLLDEEFGVGLGDDDEYCFRMRAYGYKLALSLGAFVYHWHRTTFNKLGLPVDKLQRKHTALLRVKKRGITNERPST
jgi:O-antigen biosynthesis protein